MNEYFIRSNSFAAPFCSDTGTGYVKGDTPEESLTTFASEYGHPFGLYAAEAYASADAFHKNEKPLARWRCNHEIAKQKATEGKEGHSYLGHGPGDFEVNGERIKVKDPKGGRVVSAL